MPDSGRHRRNIKEPSSNGDYFLGMGPADNNGFEEETEESFQSFMYALTSRVPSMVIPEPDPVTDSDDGERMLKFYWDQYFRERDEERARNAVERNSELIATQSHDQGNNDGAASLDTRENGVVDLPKAAPKKSKKKTEKKRRSQRTLSTKRTKR